MKYLIIDDMPEYLDLLENALRDAGHEVNIAQNLSVGWKRIENNCDKPFDLVILDLALDIGDLGFTEERSVILNVMGLRHLEILPGSGQELGLRLWRRRREMRQRYCYMTNNRFLWMPQLDEGDPEFGQRASEQELLAWIPDLILEKSELWPHNVAEKFKAAWQIWDNKGWPD